MRIISAFLIQFFITFSNAAYAKESRLIKYNNRHLQYMGRVKMNADNIEMYWSGSSVKLSFIGSSVKAILKDEKANNYYEVIVDDLGVNKFKLDSNKTTYTLIQNLVWGRHTVELSKCTEWNRGKTLFYGFEIDGRKVYNLSIPQRRMEFYGNSITCGFGVEDSVSDSGVSKFENNFLSYASLTARHFKAQYHCIAKSGIGLMVSFQRMTMPEMYNLLDPLDSLHFWDFRKYSPGIVVIDLCENDAAIVTRLDNPEFKRVFGTTPPNPEFIINSYVEFLKAIRDKYPDASIICTLGSMGAVKPGSLWPGYIKSAAESLKDKKVYTYFFGYKGSPGHPKIKDHKIMADGLVEFIDKNVNW